MGPSSISLLSILLFSASFPQPVVPNFPDLKIKIRRIDSISATTETLYLKGSRQRQEVTQDAPIKSSYVGISQCDQKRRISLNPDANLYAEFPIAWSKPRKGTAPLFQKEGSGPEVLITVDSIDTGEQRRVGRFTARHVKVSIRTEASPGAAMHWMLEERDGWYIDLPGLGCQGLPNRPAVGISFLAPAISGHQDRLRFKRLGTALTGFAIEETTTRTEADRTSVSKIALLDFADSPLDSTLFERPPGYAAARRTLHGGYDMTHPETLSNRIQVGWADLTSSLRSLF